jgi:hypothetical protein
MGRHRRDSNKPLGDYPVGYCKTDPKTRFPYQKVSRKPRKRPKRPKTLIEHIEDILDSTVEVRGQDGRVRRVNVRRRMAVTYVDMALKGDRQVFLAIVKLLESELRRSDPDTSDTAAETDADDEAIIEAFLQRLKGPDGEDGP